MIQICFTKTNKQTHHIGIIPHEIADKLAKLAMSEMAESNDHIANFKFEFPQQLGLNVLLWFFFIFLIFANKEIKQSLIYDPKIAIQNNNE